MSPATVPMPLIGKDLDQIVSVGDVVQLNDYYKEKTGFSSMQHGVRIRGWVVLFDERRNRLVLDMIAMDGKSSGKRIGYPMDVLEPHKPIGYLITDDR